MVKRCYTCGAIAENPEMVGPYYFCSDCFEVLLDIIKTAVEGIKASVQ